MIGYSLPDTQKFANLFDGEFKFDFWFESPPLIHEIISWMVLISTIFSLEDI